MCECGNGCLRRVPSVCQKAQANLAKVRETGSTWEFHIPRIDTWGYLAVTHHHHPFPIVLLIVLLVGIILVVIGIVKLTSLLLVASLKGCHCHPFLQSPSLSN